MIVSLRPEGYRNVNNLHSKKVLTLSASDYTHFKKHIIDDGHTNSTISIHCKKQKITLKGEHEKDSQYKQKGPIKCLESHTLQKTHTLNNVSLMTATQTVRSVFTAKSRGLLLSTSYQTLQPEVTAVEQRLWQKDGVRRVLFVLIRTCR